VTTPLRRASFRPPGGAGIGSRRPPVYRYAMSARPELARVRAADTTVGDIERPAAARTVASTGRARSTMTGRSRTVTAAWPSIFRPGVTGRPGHCTPPEVVRSARSPQRPSPGLRQTLVRPRPTRDQCALPESVPRAGGPSAGYVRPAECGGGLICVVRGASKSVPLADISTALASEH
jgi:hypothetical protein